MSRAERRYVTLEGMAFDLDLRILAPDLVWPGRRELCWTAQERGELGNTFFPVSK